MFAIAWGLRASFNARAFGGPPRVPVELYRAQVLESP
nr:MAG TPA: hypothetical protein [Caudoviricetes sp.]